MKSVDIENVKVIVEKCDITKEDVDAIVNAANSHLVHGGGVALAIARAGGDVVTRESKEYVKKHGPLPTGKAAVTSGGNLKAKYVIHTVGPVWGEGDEERKLFNAFYNSLLKADELALKSVAFPAVSSGIYGFPKKRCAEVFFKAVRQYLKENDTRLSFVKMCLYSQEDYEIFENTMWEAFDVE